MVLGGVGIGDQDRGPPDRGQVRDGRGPARAMTSCASVIRSGTSSKKARTSASIPARSRRPRRAPCLLAGLVAHAEHGRGSRAEAAPARAARNPRAPARPGCRDHEDRTSGNRPAECRRPRRGRGSPAAPGCRGARAVTPSGSAAGCVPQATRSNALCEESVDLAQHAVLFVDHRRHAQRDRGRQRGDRGITAEARHHGGRSRRIARRAAMPPASTRKGTTTFCRRLPRAKVAEEMTAGPRPPESRPSNARRAHRATASPASRAPASSRPAPGRGTCALRCRPPR